MIGKLETHEILVFNAVKCDSFDDWLKRQELFCHIPNKVTKQQLTKRIVQFLIEKNAIDPDSISLKAGFEANELLGIIENHEINIYFNPISKEIIKQLLSSPFSKINFINFSEKIYKEMSPLLSYKNYDLCQNIISYNYDDKSASITKIELDFLIKQIKEQASTLKNTQLDLILFSGGHGSSTLMNQLGIPELENVVNLLKKYKISANCIGIDSCYSAAHIPVLKNLLSDNSNACILANQGTSLGYFYRDLFLSKKNYPNIEKNPSVCYYELESDTLFTLSEKAKNRTAKKNAFWIEPEKDKDSEKLQLKFGIKIEICNVQTMKNLITFSNREKGENSMATSSL